MNRMTLFSENIYPTRQVVDMFFLKWSNCWRRTRCKQREQVTSSQV